MKVAWADLKNQNKHLPIDKKKLKDDVTVTIKLAWDKTIVAAVEYSESFSERNQSVYQETLPLTSDFNHPIEDYVNYMPTEISARMKIAADSDLGSSFRYC